MSEPILEAVGLHKSFGGVHATDDLHLSVQPGELHAVSKLYSNKPWTH